LGPERVWYCSRLVNTKAADPIPLAPAIEIAELVVITRLEENSPRFCG
jgi:hypothetical protein